MQINGRIALSVEKTAERLGVTPGTLSLWMKQRRIPYYRIGARRIWLDPLDVENFVRESRTPIGLAS